MENQSQGTGSHTNHKAVRLVSLAVIAFFATVFITNWLKKHWDSYKARSILGMLHIPTDNPTSYYGPIIRRVDQLPTSMHDLICRSPRNDCPANSGQNWSVGDLGIKGLPNRQLVWFRRMGNRYLMRIDEAGYAGPEAVFGVYGTNTVGEVEEVASFGESDFYNHYLERKMRFIQLDPLTTRTVVEAFEDYRFCQRYNTKHCEDITWP